MASIPEHSSCIQVGHDKTQAGAGAAGHDKTLSKRLSWLLRHGAETVGLQLLPGGFLPVRDVLATPNLRRYSEQDFIRVVDQNDKQRFSLREDDEVGLLIRANQGHSLKVMSLPVTCT